MKRVIYACDVGSVRAGSFAWARIEPGPGSSVPETSSSIDDLIARLRQDLCTEGVSIALGLESPLFMPVPGESGSLCRGRGGEGNRSMFAPAGAAVTTIGVHEAAWILKALRGHSAPDVEYSIDWNAWPPRGDKRILLLWEAFVSGPAHGATHEQDAATAAAYFYAHEQRLEEANAVSAERPLNLMHCAALWAGWASDLDCLHRPCLVLKPDHPYSPPGGST